MLQTLMMGIFENLTEPAFLLIGLLLGLFYGFDGWQGSPEKIAFSKSARAKNLLWVLGGALTTFLTGLIFEEVSKARLLLFYLLAFVFGAALVVVGIGIVLLIKYTYIKAVTPEQYPAPPFSPLIDYLFYGYRFVREEYSKGLLRRDQQNQEKRNEFLPEYGKQVSHAVAAVSAYADNPNDITRAEITKTILTAICFVMHLYHPNERGLWFNANCMIAYDRNRVPPDVKKRVLFTWGDLDRYEYYLLLYAYADSKGAQNFSLPVEPKNVGDSYNRVLPGAPQAFLLNETVICDNIRDIQYLEAVPSSVREQIGAYFQGRTTFQSFACLNVAFGGRQVGLVNIESSHRDIFGANQEHKAELEALLFPFCFLLGFLIE
jgi:hypothetical protein